jgi:hypothetical protein
MSNDVLITPASRKIEFKDSSANVDAKIETDASGNLVITNAGGDISIGDTTSDIFVGDGTNNIDIVFEQDGEIRGTSGVTVTLGQSDSNVRMATDLNLNSNDITNAGSITGTSFSDGTISGITFIDEDSFATNSATRVPTQQSIKAYVDAEVAGVVDSAPAALNTLNELAAALGDDASFSTTTSTALGNRLRVDTAAQGLTGTQQANAITNLGITATKAELNYVDGVTSNIQTQLNGKQASGSYLTTSTSFGGDVSGTYNAIVIANDSHTHTFDNLTGKQAGTGDYSTTGALVAGRGSGSIAMTINDGYGNSNLTFNHQSGTPDQNGNAARIEVNTDASTNASMNFEIKSGVTGGTPAGLTTVLNLAEGVAAVTGNITVTGTVDGRDIASDGSKLDGIESGATADQTAAQILTAIKTVDGAGSGLDADLLDGISSASFLRSDANDTATGNITFNGDIYGRSVNAQYSQIYRMGGIFFTWDSDSYGTNLNHSITSTENGTYTDGITINSYGNVRINIDSNSNDTSTFSIGAGGTGTTGTLLTLDESGNLTITGTVDGRDVATDGTKLDGIAANANNYSFPYTVSASAGNNTVVQRNSSGYIFSNYFNGTGTFSTTGATSGMGRFTGTNGTDTYGRSYTAAAARALLNVEDGATADQTITLSGDASGSGTTSIAVTVADNSHNHSSSSGDFTVNGGNLYTGTSQQRVKVAVWSGTTYGIGMGSGYTFGGIANEYVLSNQMSNTNTRGFWWGDSGHTNAQGAMALTTQGYLTVANRIRVGYGESDTTTPSKDLDVSGEASIGSLMVGATTTPAMQLQVKDTTNYHGILVNGNAAPNVCFDTSTGTTPEWKVGISGNDATKFAISKGTANDDKLTIDSSGNAAVSGNVTAYSSDERLKTNITPIENPIEKVKQLNGVEFDWKDNVEELGFTPRVKHETGVIAQNVQSVIPDATPNAPFNEEYLTVQHEKIIPVLIEAIKEQQKQIDELKQALHEQKEIK